MPTIIASAHPAFTAVREAGLATETIGRDDKCATRPGWKRWAGKLDDLGKIIDHGVIALIVLAAASLLASSYATASNSRELLPIMIVTAG